MNIGRCFLVLAAASLLMGCEEAVAPGPSYAELVVTYNAELETLERLEAKHEKLAAELVSATKVKSGKSIPDLEGLLESAKELKEGAKELPSDPEALLDHITEGGGEAHELAGQLLDGLLGGGQGQAEKVEATPEEIAAAAERKAKLETELAKLDEELAKQRERVERARDARDVADSKRN